MIVHRYVICTSMPLFSDWHFLKGRRLTFEWLILIYIYIYIPLYVTERKYFSREGSLRKVQVEDTQAFYVALSDFSSQLIAEAINRNYVVRCTL